MKFPACEQLISNLDLYRFTSCFDMFISSGELQDEALKKSLSVVETDVLRGKIERCVRKMDEEGKSFSQTAYEEQLYDAINNRMLIPAERSGMLDSILQKIMRNLKDNEVEEYEVSGDHIQGVWMKPGWTHNIINLSDTEDLVTVMWASEMLDKSRPDI